MSLATVEVNRMGRWSKSHSRAVDQIIPIMINVVYVKGLISYYVIPCRLQPVPVGDPSAAIQSDTSLPMALLGLKPTTIHPIQMELLEWTYHILLAISQETCSTAFK